MAIGYFALAIGALLSVIMAIAAPADPEGRKVSTNSVNRVKIEFLKEF